MFSSNSTVANAADLASRRPYSSFLYIRVLQNPRFYSKQLGDASKSSLSPSQALEKFVAVSLLLSSRARRLSDFGCYFSLSGCCQEPSRDWTHCSSWNGRRGGRRRRRVYFPSCHCFWGCDVEELHQFVLCSSFSLSSSSSELTSTLCSRFSQSTTPFVLSSSASGSFNEIDPIVSLPLTPADEASHEDSRSSHSSRASRGSVRG